MRAMLISLLDRYRAHHDMDRPLLQWIGVVGCVAFPLFYLLRHVAAAMPVYDDLELRLVAAVLCLGLALRHRWPARLRRFYIDYSYLVVFYSLSFLLSFTMLKNQGGTASVVNMVMGAVLIILLADWRNTIAMLLAGYVLALGAYWLTDPQPQVPREFILAGAGSLLIVVGGALSHQGQKRAEINRMRLLYAALAGSIAHEMRNPLAQLRHALDSIAHTLAPPGAPGAPGDARPQPEQVAAVLAAVGQGRQAVTRGLQAIQLTLQQLQPTAANRERFRPVSALACVRKAVDDYAYDDAGQRSKVRVQDADDFVFLGDAVALELVLFNLLKNALHYVPLFPEATVTLAVVRQPGPRIVVRDTGPGIAPELLPRLFQEFQTAGKAGGTGLGLPFCRRVMQAFGGDIACRSEPGAFTEFTLSFPPPPADAAALSPLAAAAEPARPPRGRTVLVVDDQALNRAIARLRLTELGLQVVEAEHGRQALQLLQDGLLPDAVLMDVNMPGLSGIETASALRALPGAAGSVPVLALTANNSAALAQASRDAGMQGVLVKPIDSDLLSEALAQVLGAAPQATPGAQVAPRSLDLLNAARLDDFRRLGILHELLPESLGEMRRLGQRLRTCAAAGDRRGLEQALHSLLGLAGEAGAQALHRRVRPCYEALLQGAPDEADWIDDVQALVSATEEAMAQRYGVRAAGATPLDQTSSHSFRV